MSKTWKAVERRVARFFNTERTPLSGGNGKITRSDTLHPNLFIECKYRVRHAVISLWRDTAEKAKVENKIPVVALAEKNKEGIWFMVHSKDIAKFIDIVGETLEIK